ncbi:MAG: inverse autotransporter beta domain-containing protein [Deltaproteobacteria bacterium]|jgi:hypothetical protein|nr:inverse autotransporter beta domain-containing protein [Deltaproteobacteria bacterium]
MSAPADPRFKARGPLYSRALLFPVLLCLALSFPASGCQPGKPEEGARAGAGNASRDAGEIDLGASFRAAKEARRVNPPFGEKSVADRFLKKAPRKAAEARKGAPGRKKPETGAAEKTPDAKNRGLGEDGDDGADAEIVSLDAGAPGEARDLRFRILVGGGPPPFGSLFEISGSENLSPVFPGPARTGRDGVFVLPSARIPDPGAPSFLRVLHQGREIRARVGLAAAGCGITLEETRENPRGSFELKLRATFSGGGTRGKKGKNVRADGRIPLRFFKNPNFPNLRTAERLTDPSGRLLLKGLKINDREARITAFVAGRCRAEFSPFPENGDPAPPSGESFREGEASPGSPLRGAQQKAPEKSRENASGEKGDPPRPGAADGSRGSVKGFGGNETSPGVSGRAKAGFLEEKVLELLDETARSLPAGGTLPAKGGRGGNAPDAADLALRRGSERLSGALGGWFSRHGKAQVGLFLDRDGKTRGNAFLLQPFYDDLKNTAFLQTGARIGSDRKNLHLGLGFRRRAGENSLMGANLFLDREMEGGHFRGGFGLEFFHDLTEISANAYFPLGPFRESKKFPGALERPAGGYDLRILSATPFYDKVKLSLAYERWRGSFLEGRGLETASADPKRASSSFSYGVRFNPWRFLTLSLEKSAGGVSRGLSARLLFNLDFLRGGADAPAGGGPGEGAVDLNRFEFVNRRYDLPLEFKAAKEYVVSLHSLLAGTVCLKVQNSLGVPWRQTPVKILPLSPGFSILDEVALTERSLFTTDEGGVVCAALRSGGEADRGTILAEAGDGRETFTLPLDPEGASPPLPEGGAARVEYLKEEDGVHLFRVVDARGEPQNGTGVQVADDSPAVLILEPATETEAEFFLSGPDGIFGLKAESSDPRQTEAVLLISPEGGEPARFVLPLNHLLSLSAAPTALPPREETEVKFRLLLNGRPPAPGLPYVLAAESPLIRGLPFEGLTGDGDSSPVVSLEALAAGDLGRVVARLEGLESNPASFTGLEGGDYVLESAEKVLFKEEAGEVSFRLYFNGSPLGENAAVELIQIVPPGGRPALGLENPYFTDSLGFVAVRELTPRGEGDALEIRARVMGSLTNSVFFSLKERERVLSLQAAPSGLDYPLPAEIVLFPLMNGERLPAGTVLSLKGDRESFQNLPESAPVNGDGEIILGGVVPLKASGTLKLWAESGTLVSNEVYFEIRDYGAYSLSASRDALELGEPVEVVFSLFHDETSLPEGAEVFLIEENAGDFSGILNPYLTDSRGRIILEALAAKRSPGPLKIRARINGRLTNPAIFQVTEKAPSTLTLTVSPDAVKFLEENAVRFDVRLDGHRLEAGDGAEFLFLAEEFLNLPAEGTIDASGSINVSNLVPLKEGLLSGIRVSRAGLVSNEVRLISLKDGPLTLAADKNSLEALKPERVLFTLSHKGVPLPRGVPVSFQEDSPGGFAPLGEGYLTGEGGTVEVGDLTALKSSGQWGLHALAGGVATNSVSFAPFSSGPLALEAAPAILPFLRETEARFTVALDGIPLESGERLNLHFDAGDLAAGSLEVVVGAGGAFTETLKPLSPLGPLPARVSAGNLGSNEVFFQVLIDPDAFSVKTKMNPDLSGSEGYAGLEHPVDSCALFQAEFQFSYLGLPLANTPLRIYGLGFRGEGELLETDGEGKIRSEVFYDALDEDYFLEHPSYRALLGETWIPFVGPEPASFFECP